MWCSYRVSSEVYCPNNTAKQMSEKVHWPRSCFERQTDDIRLPSSVDCSVKGG